MRKKQTDEVPVPEQPMVVCPEPSKGPLLDLLPVEPTAVFDDKNAAWVGLTPQQYLNLSTNMQNILRNLRQKNAIINYYRNCIEDANKTH